MSSSNAGDAASGSSATGMQNALGSAKSAIDIESLARKVYNLMLNDARLSSHRHGLPRKPRENSRL